MAKFVLTSQQHLTKDVIKVTASPENENMDFLAGQYVEILYPDRNFYPFSVANAPRENGELIFYIRIRPDDIPLKKLLAELALSPSLTIRGPKGDSFYRSPGEKELILVAGGTGIAQTMAIIEAASSRDSLNVFWGAVDPHEFYLDQQLKALISEGKINKYVPVLSGDHVWEGEKGFVHEVVLQYFPDLENTIVYASGPYELVRSARQHFLVHGLGEEEFYADV